jgi:hypothetical protein
VQRAQRGVEAVARLLGRRRGESPRSRRRRRARTSRCSIARREPKAKPHITIVTRPIRSARSPPITTMTISEKSAVIDTAMFIPVVATSRSVAPFVPRRSLEPIAEVVARK